MTVAVANSRSVARISADLAAVCLWSALGLVLTIMVLLRLGYGAAISQALALAG